MEIVRNESIAIDTDAVVISIEKNNVNARRNVISIINTSTGGQIITIAPDGVAVAGQGIQPRAPLLQIKFFFFNQQFHFFALEARTFAARESRRVAFVVCQFVRFFAPILRFLRKRPHKTHN